MAQTSPLLEVVLDPNNILSQIDAALERLIRSNPIPPTGISRETFVNLDILMREVIKIAKSGFFPGLGQRLFAKFQELETSARCSEILTMEWCHVEDNQETKAFLVAMMYLKLAALCGFEDARSRWVSYCKKVKYDRPPHDALDDLDLITLYRTAGGVCYRISAMHEFVGVGMYLMCKAYKKQSKIYQLYKALLRERTDSRIPDACDCADYAGQYSTTAMVDFLVQQLDGTF
jgi:hypothetical protein